MKLLDKIATAYKLLPALDGLLSARAIMAIFGEIKSYDYFERHVEGLVRGVYNGYIGGEFIDTLLNLVQGQLTQAYEQAWKDDGNELPLPDYLQASLDEMLNSEIDYIDGYYHDIVDARVDNTPIDPLLVRASMWANRYNDALNKANMEIAAQTGGKLVWRIGATEKHCETCAALDGIVAYATEWQASGLSPQNPPNTALECGGWQCDCSLEPTDERKTRGAVDRLQEISTRTLTNA